MIRSRAQVIPAQVADAKAEAAAILATARDEATRLRAEALGQARQAREDAERAGLEAGRASVAALETRALEARGRAVDEAEQTVVGLVTSIAERVLQGALADAPERIVPIVRAQLDRVRRARTVEIRVHPDDLPALEAALRGGGLKSDALLPTLTGDPELARGGCLLVSDLGTLDGRLEVQLAAFARALEGAR